MERTPSTPQGPRVSRTSTGLPSNSPLAELAIPQPPLLSFPSATSQAGRVQSLAHNPCLSPTRCAIHLPFSAAHLHHQCLLPQHPIHHIRTAPCVSPGCLFSPSPQPLPHSRHPSSLCRALHRPPSHLSVSHFTGFQSAVHYGQGNHAQRRVSSGHSPPVSPSVLSTGSHPSRSPRLYCLMSCLP